MSHVTNAEQIQSAINTYQAHRWRAERAHKVIKVQQVMSIERLRASQPETTGNASARSGCDQPCKDARRARARRIEHDEGWL